VRRAAAKKLCLRRITEPCRTRFASFTSARQKDVGSPDSQGSARTRRGLKKTAAAAAVAAEGGNRTSCAVLMRRKAASRSFAHRAVARRARHESAHRQHYIVTEFGSANLKGLSSTERAHALIGLAHPQFREELTAAAKKLNLI
jgi:hypothetical protein